MTAYRVEFSKKAQKDIQELSPKQKEKLKEIITKVILENPYIGKSLKGKLKGLYSYRLSYKDRLVYEIYEDEKTILMIRVKTHYGE